MKKLLLLLLFPITVSMAAEPDLKFGYFDFFESQDRLEHDLKATSNGIIPNYFKSEKGEVAAYMVGFGSGNVSSELFVYSKIKNSGWFLVFHLGAQRGGFIPKFKNDGSIVIISTISGAKETPIATIQPELLYNIDTPITKQTQR
jgi:hypothetical protein